MVGQTFFGLGHDPVADFAHGLLDSGVFNLFLAEGGNGNLAVHQGRRHVVLGAELALQLVVRLLVEHYNGQEGLVHFHVLYVVIGKAVLAHQAEQAVQHGVVTAAAGIFLNHQGILDAEGLAHVRRHLVQVVNTLAQDGSGVSQGMLQNLLAGGQTPLGQLGGGYAVAADQAGVEGLGHSAEVVDQSAGH